MHQSHPGDELLIPPSLRVLSRNHSASGVTRATEENIPALRRCAAHRNSETGHRRSAETRDGCDPETKSSVKNISWIFSSTVFYLPFTDTTLFTISIKLDQKKKCIDAKQHWCWRPLWLWWPGLWLLIYMSRVTPPGQPGQGGAHQCHWSYHRVISGYTSLVPGGCQVRPHTSK